MADPAYLPRHVEPRLAEALSDSPVVLVHGPRQSGKSTLAGRLGARTGAALVNFDDEIAVRAAVADPMGFVADLPERVILDEIQRVPGLFTAIKAAVDRRRVPGRFLLTGSANVLTLPRLSDSLAGRMEIVRLHPLSQAEIAGRKEPGFLPALFGDGHGGGAFPRLGIGLAERIAAGGYPAALARPNPKRREVWHRDYIETLVQRDVGEFSRIRSLDVMPRLLGLVAAQTAGLLNVSTLAAPFQVSRPTIGEYVTLLERVFLIDRLPPWHSNRLKRLVKTPKVHMGDTGLACALLGCDAGDLQADRPLLGHMLETFVHQELRRQASALESPPRFFHFRDKDGAEVDIVLEHGGRRVSGVEVKASSTVTPADFRGMRRLKEAAGARFHAGVVLYDGESIVPFGNGMRAVPLSSLWEAE